MERRVHLLHLRDTLPPLYLLPPRIPAAAAPFIALSAISVRFLTGLLTPAWDLYGYLSFSVATWGILALLSPPARFVRERACYVFLAGFLMTLPALVTWSCYFLTGSFPQPETLLALLQTNVSEAAGYLSGHLSHPL